MTRDPVITRSVMTLLAVAHVDYVRCRNQRAEAAARARQIGLTWREIGLAVDMTSSGARALAQRRQEDES